MKKTVPFSYDDEGQPVICPSTEAAVDWLRAARLKRRAEQGDEAAQKEFDKMNNTPLVVLDPEDLL